MVIVVTGLVARYYMTMALIDWGERQETQVIRVPVHSTSPARMK